jgi:hypothetical protein
VGASSDKLFDYTQANDSSIIFESTNDQDQDDPINWEPIVDKHDIAHSW